MRLIDRPDQTHPPGVEPIRRPGEYINPPIQRTHSPDVETGAGSPHGTTRTEINGERPATPSGRQLDQAFLFDTEQGVPSPVGTADTGEMP
jgi:hypothetical protein